MRLTSTAPTCRMLEEERAARHGQIIEYDDVQYDEELAALDRLAEKVPASEVNWLYGHLPILGGFKHG